MGGRDVRSRVVMMGGKIKMNCRRCGEPILLVESRNEAFSRMLADAKARGANGVVNLRFATSAVSPGAAELFCYGTAVIVE